MLENNLQLHPMLVLLSVYLGIRFLGVMGIIVGPLYGIIAKEIIYSDEEKAGGILWEKYLY